MFEQPEVWFPLVATCLARRVQKLFVVGRERARAQIACENIRFSSLFAAGDVSRGGGSSARNVPSDEERGETDVFAG